MNTVVTGMTAITWQDSKKYGQIMVLMCLLLPATDPQPICLRPDHFRGDVKAALLKVFSRRMLPDGTRGLFHPDNFTFGQPVYLSRIYAAAQAVDGVASAEVTQFGRQGRPDPQALQDGMLRFARLEIPQLDNDPNFPERGVFRLIMEGGK